MVDTPSNWICLWEHNALLNVREEDERGKDIHRIAADLMALFEAQIEAIDVNSDLLVHIRAVPF